MAHADAVFLGEAEGRMEEVFADFRNGAAASRSTTISTTGPRSRCVGPARRSILQARALQLQGRADGGPGPRLARLPLQLLPLRRRLPGRPQLPAAAHRQGDRGDGRHRQQPALHRRQLAGPGHAVGDGPVPGDDPAQEEVVSATPSRTSPRCSTWRPRPAPGTCTRPSSTPRTIIRERIKRYHDHGIAVEGTILLGLDDHDRGLHQAADRLPAGDRARPGRVHGPDALPAHPGLRRPEQAEPHLVLRLERLHGRQGGVPAQAHEPRSGCRSCSSTPGTPSTTTSLSRSRCSSCFSRWCARRWPTTPSGRATARARRTCSDGRWGADEALRDRAQGSGFRRNAIRRACPGLFFLNPQPRWVPADANDRTIAVYRGCRKKAPQAVSQGARCFGKRSMPGGMSSIYKTPRNAGSRPAAPFQRSSRSGNRLACAMRWIVQLVAPPPPLLFEQAPEADLEIRPEGETPDRRPHRAPARAPAPTAPTSP